MSGILAHPFRIAPTGAAVTIPHGADAEVDQAIATLALTRIGERPMVHDYGIPDPAFYGIHIGDIQTGLDTWGPQGITITGMRAIAETNTQTKISIQWDRDTTTSEAQEPTHV